jgi:predicted Zn-dependent protease with MMP-like domain
MDEVAVTLIHEAAHEFGWTDDDKELIESLARLCVY